MARGELSREAAEAALRCWGEYQRVKADGDMQPSRRRACAGHGGKGWTSERIGFVAAVAWQVDRALDGLESPWREAVTLVYVDGLHVDAARKRASVAVTREVFRARMREAVYAVGLALARQSLRIND